MEYKYELKIPKERVAVLIGKNGETKKHLEEQTNSTIEVDSHEGDCFIRGSDTIQLYSLKSVIKAIGRGFNPDIAQLLLKPDFAMEIINLTEFSNPNHFKRIKGRLIGSGGKARANVERLTESYISIYGKTVCIIGEISDVSVARRAVEALIRGSRHATVYSALEKQRRDSKIREIMGKS